MASSVGITDVTAEIAGEGGDVTVDHVDNVESDPCGAHTDAGRQGSDIGSVPKVKRRIRRPISWTRMLAFAVLPTLAMLLGVAAGWLKWVDASQREAQRAAVESVEAAKEATVAMLSYHPDTVQNDLDAAKGRLLGAFRNSYGALVDDVVAPSAIQKLITAQASVPAAASVSATENHAVTLVFVNQVVAIGQEAPTTTASSVRVTLDKIDGHWLVSGFDPV